MEQKLKRGFMIEGFKQRETALDAWSRVDGVTYEYVSKLFSDLDTKYGNYLTEQVKQDCVYTTLRRTSKEFDRRVCNTEKLEKSLRDSIPLFRELMERMKNQEKYY